MVLRQFRNILLVLCIILQPILAQGYYADVQIDVSPTGEVAISGVSNHPDLEEKTTQDYTSKDGRYWILNITLDGNFSEYIYEVVLPEGAVINYLNVPKNFRMESDGRIHMIATAEEQEFFVVVQYEIESFASSQNYLAYLFLLSVLIVAALVYWRFVRGETTSRSKKVLPKAAPKKPQNEELDSKMRVSKPSVELESEEEHKKAPGRYNPVLFTDRQNQILEIIEREGGHATQAKIQKETGIPKASLSRNIDSLVRRKIVKKDRKGMTMVVYFSDELKYS